ncbi:MAG: carboxymuconolactone decarboxylase family protein [Chloroflexi bacterium]|nr:carboxymuconolactone decarboxylase family protein [Chloroflexota bacterium]MCH9017072.1 carboxymuconolactone decarboxylase family protein [Chloroflexota bacterium]MCI0790048.1 carboxymuconolactone decarboxylase family protein [Chloroflexota bacterium]MCI0802007.1 carboxymuconolactone decarboxylase family protein [Chloroflexota bacterium]MCI0811891.1 carboxymuconolactone decarboxylase family protein [Chloroflexota bacterium]
MARLPIVSADMVPAEFREAFAEVTAPAGGSITGGPGSFTINSPEMAKRRNHLTSYLRYETKFPKRILELAILTTARAMDCQYVWNAHAPAARKEGVADALVDALRDKRPLPDMAPDEESIINYGNEFFKDHKIGKVTFDKALEQFGAQYLVELTALMGHYAQTCFFLNAFEAELPEQVTEKLLPV